MANTTKDTSTVPPFNQSLAHWWQHQLVVPALLIVALGLGWLAWQFHATADTTHNHRNTLSAASQQVLHDLPGRIEIIAFCSNSPFKGRYFRKSIVALVQRYQQQHRGIHLQFIDPATAPTLAREWQIKKEGEMLIRYAGQQQRLYLPYTEEAFTNALLSLQHGERAPLQFLAAHALHDTHGTGLSQLAQALQNAGIPVLTGDLPATPAKTLPSLVLAGSDKPYSPAQVAAIRQHVQQGGNLVWLTTSPQAQGLQALAQDLRLIISPGIVIDPVNRQFDIPLHDLSTQRYGARGPTQEFGLRTFFNQAHAIEHQRIPNDPWQSLPLVAAAEQGWVSASYQPAHPSPSAMTFNATKDSPGPATLMLALEKPLASGNKQRILVIASADFFSNQQIQRGGNLALSLQNLQWVVNNQPTVSLPVTPLRDTVIALPTQRTWLMLLFNGFQFGLPLALLLAGGWAWRRKQRA